MSWNHSSKLGLVLLSVILVLATVGVASAVSVTDEQAPDSATADEQVNVTVELQDLFAQESSWELSGHTELENAEWTVEFRSNGSVSDTREGSGDRFDPIYLEEGATDADTIVVEITGETPSVSNTSYADPATILVGEVVQLTEGGDDPTFLSEQRVPHYAPGDPGSREARTALDDADATIQSAAENGTDTAEAESTFDDAVAAYDGGEFANAVSLAEEAASQAQSAGSDGGSDDGGSTDGGTTDGSTDGNATDGGSADGGTTNGTDGSDGTDGGSTDTAGSDGTDAGGSDANGSDSDGGGDDGGLLWIVLYGMLGLLILGGVAGGIYWYQQQQQGPSRDPLG